VGIWIAEALVVTLVVLVGRIVYIALAEKNRREP